jgi:LPXTG-motif cell wall-anchored protein
VGVSDGDTGAAVGFGGILYLPVRVFPVTLSAIDGVSGGPVAGSPADAGNLQVLNGTLYFTGTDNLTAPDRLWKLVTAADPAPAQPELAATGVDGVASAVVGGAALASVLAGLLLFRSRFVRKGRVTSP